MPFYLGIDAGGTKTFCLVGNEEGRVLGFGRAKTGNYEAFGVAAADAEIRKAVNAALDEAGIGLDDIAGVGMGIAGADIPDDYEMLERELFTPLLGDIPRCFRNDSMAGLRGGIREPMGIVIACGTGCVCAGVNARGQETRVGGINEDFGDRTSGSSIGQEGLRAVWRARDNIYHPTKLTEKFVQRAGAGNVDALFHEMYYNRITYEDLEPMAVLVFEAAREGDAAACDILEYHGRYLGEMVNGVSRRLAMQRDVFKVVMAGSVFKGQSPVLRDAMALVIHRENPGAEPVMPTFEPVVGALLLGVELHHTVTDEAYGRLSHSLDRMGAKHGVAFRAT